MVFVATEGGGLANRCDLELGPHFISQPQVVYFVNIGSQHGREERAWKRLSTWPRKWHLLYKYLIFCPLTGCWDLWAGLGFTRKETVPPSIQEKAVRREGVMCRGVGRGMRGILILITTRSCKQPLQGKGELPAPLGKAGALIQD